MKPIVRGGVGGIIGEVPVEIGQFPVAGDIQRRGGAGGGSNIIRHVLHVRQGHSKHAVGRQKGLLVLETPSPSLKVLGRGARGIVARGGGGGAKRARVTARGVGISGGKGEGNSGCIGDGRGIRGNAGGGVGFGESIGG